MIFFNLLGAAFLIATGILVAVAKGCLGNSVDSESPLYLFLAGNLAAGIDIAYRGLWRKDQGLNRFVMPGSGGHLMFLPVWVFGVIMLGMAACDHASNGSEMRAQNDAFVEQTVAKLEDNARSFGNDDARQAKNSAGMTALRDFLVKLDDSEKRRLDRKFGDRVAKVSRLIERP
jgi:hypothetical protein